MKKLLLIDGSSLAFRAFYGLNDLNRFKTKKGFHTNALYAFHTMLEAILQRETPTHVLVAFDAGKSTFRTEKYADYKGGRASMPSELAEQWPYFKIFLDAYGIAHYDLINYEADDIIGTLATQASCEMPVVIVTGDKDMLQLVSDNIRVDIIKKGAEVDSHTVDVIQERMGIAPKQIIDVKGLMGDSSDNYPGVTKVGEKTALKLIQEYGSIENLYEHVDTLKASKLKENLINDKNSAFLSKDLATIRVDSPLAVSVDDTVLKEKNSADLTAYYQQMEFNQFLSRLDVQPIKIEKAKKLTYQVVNEVFSEQLSNAKAFYIERLHENYHTDTPLSLSWINHDVIYIMPWQYVSQSQRLKEWISSDTPKTTYDLKEAYVLFHHIGWTLKGVQMDVSLAAYLNDTNDSRLTFTQIIPIYTSGQIALDETIYGKGAKQHIPEDAIWQQHVAQKTQALEEVAHQLQDALQKNQLMHLYEAIELPLASVLAKMEVLGITVDTQVLQSLGHQFTNDLIALESEIYALAGEQFNIASPKQLGVILFEKLNLPAGKKTKTGYSTAVDVLEKLSGYPIVEKILTYRQLSKLNSTYVEGLQKYIGEDNRIHTRFVQTLTQTGRLSSTDPNLQNIPIRLEQGRQIRAAFKPNSSGNVLLSADYSQIELRILAHISNETHMIEAFKNGEDIHTSTAMRVFGVEKHEVDDLMRRQAKAVNFGLVYGISDYGLSQNLNITRKQAQQFIDTYFEKYPNIKTYMDQIVESAKKDGYVKTLFNRRRYLNDINASNFNLRSFAERTAMNTPIQGSAADVIKIAMIQMDNIIREKGLQSKLLLQVHDELIFDVPVHELDIMEQLVVQTMENAVDLSVTLEVNLEHGTSWYDAK
ncbi:DNA polymerase I [Carnobacteriaceae bacterium zg-ZUI240]|nr:DNA polymerase I [Carnobacteriaceae bacterium zg-ZUI240]